MYVITMVVLDDKGNRQKWKGSNRRGVQVIKFWLAQLCKFVAEVDSDTLPHHVSQPLAVSCGG